MKNTCKLLCMAAGFALLLESSLMAAEKEQYFGAGKGTKESPYWVENAEQLQNVRLFPNAYFVQTCNIDVGSNEFKPIGDFNTPFTGKYDGEGHSITIKELGATNGNIKLSGLWGFTSGAEIKNLNLDVYASLNLDGRVCFGGLVGCANNTYINNCNISSESNLQITSEKCLYAGGIVGYSAFDSLIRNCTFDGSLQGRSRGDVDAVCAVGGIAGENRTGSKIKKSTFGETATVFANSAIAPSWVGGIAGFNEDSTYVCDCHAVVPMNLKPEYKNLKRVFTKITKCNSAGSVSGYSLERVAVGGIVGFNVADVAHCVSHGNSKTRGAIIRCSDSPSALIGGIVGDNVGNVYNSASLTSIQILSDGFLGVGGVVGRNSGSVKSCNYFAVSSSFTALRSFNVISAIESISARGGIVGINDNSYKKSNIDNCKVLGNDINEAILTYGHARGSSGKIIGLEVK